MTAKYQDPPSYGYADEPPPVRRLQTAILVMGNAGVGKTWLIQSLVRNRSMRDVHIEFPLREDLEALERESELEV